MQLKIEPTAELTLKLADKKIGKLEALCIDISNGGGFLGVPKVKLSISINASSFDSDPRSLEILKSKISKFSFLDVVIRK